jgi:hypothetical protein
MAKRYKELKAEEKEKIGTSSDMMSMGGFLHIGN